MAKQTNIKKKNEFLKYFKELPVQKLAAAHIGVHETTIINWKKADSNFSNQIDQAKAAWALKKVKEVKSPEWLLERIMRDNFTQQTKIDMAHHNYFLVQEIYSEADRLSANAN